MVRRDVGQPVAQRNFAMRLPNGEWVEAQEKFFFNDTATTEIYTEGWSDEEKNVIAEHDWWSADGLRTTDEMVYPQNIAEILDSI